jgi:membrane-bound lytic murein transglycosylase B
MDKATRGTEYDALFQAAGEKYGVEPSILRAIASVESNFNPQAVGPKTRSGRAQGMMQFVPATAKAYNLEDPFNPEQSVDAAARLMRDLQKQYKGDVGKALEAYNGGPRLVGKSKQTAKYREMVLARAGRAPSDEIPEPAQPIIGAKSVPKELKQGQMYGEAPKMPAAAPRQVTMGTIEGMPPSYRTAFALQYLADTEPDDDPEAKANDLLARLDELEAEDAPLASSKLASFFAEQAAQPMNAFQTIQSKRNPQKQQKKRALPSMQVVQGFAEGGDVSKDFSPEMQRLMREERMSPSSLQRTTLPKGSAQTATIALPGLRAYVDPALTDTYTAGYVFGDAPVGDTTMFLRGDRDLDTVAHESEHLLAKRQLEHPTEINSLFDSMFGDKEQGKSARSSFVRNAVDLYPYLQEKYGVQSAYFQPEMYDYQRRYGAAQNLLYEQLATLSAIEQNQKVDLTKDPELRKTLFSDKGVREAYNALTGLRQTRLDSKDIRPHTRVPEKETSTLDTVKQFLGFKDGGEVDVSEQMTVGTLPEDAKDYKEVLKGLKKSLGDIRRGIQYAPADLVGAPVDIANMVLQPFGLGSEKPFMGSEYLIDKGVEAGIYEKPSGTATETLSRLGAGIMAPTLGARTVGRGIASLEESLKGPPEGAIKPRGGIIDPGLVDPKVTPSTLLAEPRQVTRARETAQAKLKDAMGRDIDPEKRDALVNFIDSKYSKYVTTDLGTEADPVRQTMKQGKTVPSSRLASEKDIYDQLANVQSLRTTGKPVEETVFFPANIEEAERSFERAYDRATNIKPRMLVRATDLDEDSREILARSASRIDVYNLIKRTAANEVYGSSLPLKVGVFAKMDPPLGIQKIVRNYVDQVKKNAQLMEQEGNPDGLETLLDQTNIELLSDNKYDALNDTLKRSVNKELVFSTEMQSVVGEHNPERIIETLAAVPTDKLYKLNFKEAYELGTKLLEPVRKYEQSIAMAEAKQTPPKEALFYFTNPVLDLKKGEASLQWVQLENSKAARMEGAMMGHSVGDYDKLKPYNLGGKEAFDAGNAKIFSLRTERGVPKVTLEYGKPVKDLAFYFNEPDEDLVRQVQGLSNSAPLDYLQETFDLLKKKGLRFPQGQMQSYFRDRNGKDLDQRIAINWDRLQKYYEKGNPFDYKISNDIDVNGDPVIIVTSPDDTKVYNPIDKSSVRYAKGGLVSKPLYDRA